MTNKLGFWERISEAGKNGKYFYDKALSRQGAFIGEVNEISLC